MQVSESCTLCNKPNDQMLMLSCVHDPCINCAASAYAEQVHIKGQSREVYVCEICGDETMLDNSTITELTALANSVIKMPSKLHNGSGNKTVGSNSTSTFPKRKETQHPSHVNHQGASLSTVNTTHKKVIYYCKEHSEQQISYYCFSCWANICPECAIHGAHKDHQVKLIKKAINQVKGQYQEVMVKVGESQNTMTKMKDSFLKMIKETNDRHLRQKNLVSRQCDLIRNSLQAKEKELLKELDEINKQNIAALTNFLQIINSNYEDANKVKRTVEHITKKDEVLILQDYKKISELQQSLQQLTKTTQSISGSSSQLNTQFLQQEVKAVVEDVSKIKLSLKKEDIGGGLVKNSGKQSQ